MLVLGPVQPVHRSLEVLDVGDNRLGNSGLQTLREPLMANRSLLHFGVACAHITCEGRPTHHSQSGVGRGRLKPVCLDAWMYELEWILSVRPQPGHIHYLTTVFWGFSRCLILRMLHDTDYTE